MSIRKVTSTGWFGSPGDPEHRARGSKVHFMSEGKPLCGVTFADDMIYQFCSASANWDYCECASCKRIYLGYEQMRLRRMAG